MSCIANLPGPRDVVGGTSGGVSTSLVQVYNPASNSWEISTPLPEGSSLAALGVDSLGRLIVIGGVDTNGYDLADVWRSQQFGMPDSAPALTNLPVTLATYLGNYSSTITATGSPQPVYQLLSGPAGLTVDYYSGAISWVPQRLDQIGSSTTGTNVTIGGLPANTSQAYYVKATGPGGISDPSVVAATTLPAPAPANLRVTSLTSTNIGLAWDAPLGQFPIVSHEVLGWYNGIAAQYPLAVVNIPTTSVTVTGLAPGDYMLWGVSSRDSAGNVSPYTYLPSLVLNSATPVLTPASAPPGPGGFQFMV